MSDETFFSRVLPSFEKTLWRRFTGAGFESDLCCSSSSSSPVELQKCHSNQQSTDSTRRFIKKKKKKKKNLFFTQTSNEYKQHEALKLWKCIGRVKQN